MNKLLIVISIVCTTLQLAAQTKKERKAIRSEKISALIKQEEEGVLIYKKHTIYGGSITTDGYGGFFEKGIKQDKKKTTLLRIELFEKKHIKEYKTAVSANNLGQINSAVYAKLNNFYQLKFGYGLQYLIGSKGNKNGIEVSAVGVGGLSLGLEKPYYYNVVDNMGKPNKVTFDTDDTVQYTITGASGVTYGLNKTKIKPGIFVKTGLRFDYGRLNEAVSAVDVGITAEFYSKKIRQMFALKERQFFFGAYIAMLIGKRK